MCCGKRCQNMLGYEHVLLQSVEKESIEQCSEPRKHGNTIGIYIYIHNGNITNNVFFCRFYPTCPPIILSESEFRDSAPHGWSFWRNSSIVPHSKNKKHSFENCSILTVAYLAFFYFQLWSHIQLSTVHLDQIRKYCFFTHLKHPPMDTPNWVFIGLFENKVPHNSMVYYHVSIQRDYFGVYHGIQLRPFTSYKCL